MPRPGNMSPRPVRRRDGTRALVHRRGRGMQFPVVISRHEPDIDDQAEAVQRGGDRVEAQAVRGEAVGEGPDHVPAVTLPRRRPGLNGDGWSGAARRP